MQNEFIPLSIPNIGGNESKYVMKALEAQWVSTAGQSIQEFEEKIAEYTGTSCACACQSGTAGLHLALRHFGIGEGDIVLVPTLTFIATINAVMYEKSVPVFFDCDEHLCMDMNQVRAYLDYDCRKTAEGTYEKKSGRRVKAILPVHVFGDLCDMESVMELAEEYNLTVIEDATEALGSRIKKGKYAGKMAGTIGNAGVYSFNGNKIITTGGGGMVVSDDPVTIEHIRYLSQQAKDDTFYFVHNEVGYNYRMTNIQAALGLGQLERLDEFIEVKKANYELYQDRLSGSRLGRMLCFREETKANYWFYSYCLKKEYKDLKEKLIKYLLDAGIQVRPVWKLNHTQKPFVQFDAKETMMATDMYDRIVNLPCSSNLTADQVMRVCDTILKFECENM